MALQLSHLELELLLDEEDFPQLAVADDFAHPLIELLNFLAMEDFNGREPLVGDPFQAVELVRYLCDDFEEWGESGE